MIRYAFPFLSLLILLAGCATPLGSQGNTPATKGIYWVTEFGAVGDGEHDDTQAFQRALDAAAEDGGGVVQAPSGNYLIASQLTIPDNCALQGVWQSPHRADYLPGQPEANSRRLLAGTVLHAVAGQGNPDGPAFLAMKSNTTLRGITIYYPDQPVSRTPHPYPWTIRGEGNDVALINVTIPNSYQGVDFGRGHRRHYIRGLYGQPLKTGVYIDFCHDVGRIMDVHFWPFLDPRPDSPFCEYTLAKGTAFRIGRTDGEIALNCFSIFYNTGMHFVDDGNGPGSGVYTNCYMDITPHAIRVEKLQNHAGVSFVNGMFMAGIEVAPENGGPIKFTGCGFWSNRDQTFHAQASGKGLIAFESCHFSNWDRQTKTSLAWTSTRAAYLSPAAISIRVSRTKSTFGLGNRLEPQWSPAISWKGILTS